MRQFWYKSRCFPARSARTARSASRVVCARATCPARSSSLCHLRVCLANPCQPSPSPDDSQSCLCLSNRIGSPGCLRRGRFNLHPPPEQHSALVCSKHRDGVYNGRSAARPRDSTRVRGGAGRDRFQGARPPKPANFGAWLGQSGYELRVNINAAFCA